MHDNIVDKDKLVRFLAYKHEEDYKFPISRIKLQKSLYFLYTHWIKVLSNIKNSNTELTDLVTDLPDKFFEANFEAWSYGPVDPAVYRLHRLEKIEPFSDDEAVDFLFGILETSEIAFQFLNNMVERIFKSSDFGLVHLSHEDNAWKKNFEGNNISFQNNKPISHEDILSDYEN